MKTAYVSFDLMGGTKRALDFWLFCGTQRLFSIQSIAVNRDLKKKILFFERVVTFCQFRPLKPFSRSKKGCKGTLSHEKSREGPKSFSSCPVSLEHFYG